MNDPDPTSAVAADPAPKRPPTPAEGATYLFNFWTVLVIVWAIAWPRPWHLTVIALALIPVLAIRVAKKHPEIGHRSSIFFMCFLAMIVMIMRVSDIDAEGVGYLRKSFIAAIFFGAVGLFYAGKRAKDIGGNILLLSLLFGCGAVPYINIAFDNSVPTHSIKGSVIEKHVTRGFGRASTKHYILVVHDLASKDSKSTERVSVPEIFYGDTPEGSTVCADTKPGALGMKWVDVKSC